MNFNNSLELTQSQRLIMTTQLKQSLDILNMSRLEIEEEVKKEVEENPLLDAEKSNDIDWEVYMRNIERYSRVGSGEISYNPDNELNLENIIKDSNNIYQHLKFQISLYRMEEKALEVCEYIIDSLDEDGYLRIEDKEIINNLNIDNDIFKKCLLYIQQLEPNGVGARSLSECLIIQVNNLGMYDELLKEIINKDLELIGSNKYKEISKKYNVPLQKCVDLISVIKTLDPKPGKSYSIEKSVYVQPDVIVEKIDGEFIVYTNEKDSIKLKINNFYKEVLKNSQSDENAKTFIKERLNCATGLIKNIESRKTTILKIAEEIVKYQDAFFNKGIKHIKPMKMKDIAEILEFHESTISRGVNGKYMLTPFGMFEFKYFFSTGLENEDNSLTSSKSIKKMIEEIIKQENKAKPLSDDAIVKKLKEIGISIARRTIGKYREELGILSSTKRKRY